MTLECKTTELKAQEQERFQTISLPPQYIPALPQQILATSNSLEDQDYQVQRLSISNEIKEEKGLCYN